MSWSTRPRSSAPKASKQLDAASSATLPTAATAPATAATFWGFRLHALFALDGTLRVLALTSPKTSERDVCLAMLKRVERQGYLTVVADKGYGGRDFEHAALELDANVCRPRRFYQTMAREGAYGVTYHSHTGRDGLIWLHHYNHGRPHSPHQGKPPISRVHNVCG